MVFFVTAVTLLAIYLLFTFAIQVLKASGRRLPGPSHTHSPWHLG